MATKNRLRLFYCLLTLFFALFIMGCTRTNADQAAQEMPALRIEESSASVAASAVEFSAVKYVTARDGLIMRESPSASSNRLGVLLYGARVRINQRSDFQETIGGITDYWYRGTGNNGIPSDRLRDYWLFGGFLSPTIPDDVSPLLGAWDTDGERYVWDFFPNATGRTGLREGHGLFFEWTLEETKLTATLLADEVIDGVREVGIWEIIVTVINRDRIILDFVDGVLPQEILARNSDVF